MFEKAKKLIFSKEMGMYLIFGVLTTIVSYAIYFTLIYGGVSLGFKNIKGEPTDSVRAIAQVLQWVGGVLFAFYTNRKWVFEGADTNGDPLPKQLASFAASRIATFILDTAVTFGTIWILSENNYKTIWLMTPDAIAKAISFVVVVTGNYILSKLIVFRKRKAED